MSWLTDIGMPICETEEEAVQYVTGELTRAAPRGWCVERVNGPGLRWRLLRTQIPPEEWQQQEYGVYLGTGLDLLVFTHGNKDIGPLGLQHLLQQALVIDAAAVRHFGFDRCLEYLMAEFPPNEFGYT